MDLARLSVMLENPGPFATVLVDATRDTEDAAHLIELRTRATRSQLAELGTPDDVVDMIAERQLSLTGVSGQAGRFVVATADGVIADEVLPHWHGPDEAGWGPLPDVTSWLAHRESTVPVLVVLADRTGADLHYYDAWRQEPTLDSAVDGQRLHISKVPDGGWAMAALQHRTEEVWRRNARDVAAEITNLSVPGLLVVLAGDERARHEIMTAWDPRPDQRVVQAAHGSRAPGSSEENLDAEIEKAVRDAIIGRQLSRIRELEEGAGRREAVAAGMGPVLDAFVAGRVATAFLHTPHASARAVRVADHPGWSLPTVPADVELRGDLAVLAAAATTSAEAVFVGASSVPDDGVAALLRWAEPAE